MLKYLIFVVIIILAGCKSDCQGCNNDAGFPVSDSGPEMDASTDGGLDAGTDGGEESEDAGLATLIAWVHEAVRVKAF